MSFRGLVAAHAEQTEDAAVKGGADGRGRRFGTGRAARQPLLPGGWCAGRPRDRCPADGLPRCRAAARGVGSNLARERLRRAPGRSCESTGARCPQRRGEGGLAPRTAGVSGRHHWVLPRGPPSQLQSRTQPECSWGLGLSGRVVVLLDGRPRLVAASSGPRASCRRQQTTNTPRCFLLSTEGDAR